MSEEYKEEVALIKEALLEVFHLVTEGERRQVNNDPIKPVTEIDLAAEKEVRRLIKKATDDTILGEEYGGKMSGGRHWLIDPIDGTLNFLHGITGWSSAIAFLDNGIGCVGGIMNSSGEIYIAIKDSGVYRVGEKTLEKQIPDTSPVPSLEKAVIASYFDFKRAESPEYLQASSTLLKKSGTIRAMGSGSYELLLLSLGAIDGFVQYNMHPWDYLPGEIFVCASGGKAGLVDDWFVAARNEELFSEMKREVLSK